MNDLMCYTTKAFIDFEKALNAIEWSFLFNTLSTFNFGHNYIRWMKL